VQRSVKLYGLAVTSKQRKRKEKNVKRNNMENGIGPQNLGAAGMNPKSTPCGHSISSPIDASAAQNAAFGPGSKLAKKDPKRAAAILEGINEKEDGTPLDFQDDLAKLNEAAGLFEAHNIGGGGGAAAAPGGGDVRAQQAGMAMDSMGGGNMPVAGSANLGAASTGLFTKGNLGRILSGAKRRV